MTISSATSASMVKFAASPALQQGGKLIDKWSFRSKLAWAVHKKAKRRNIRISFNAIRKWLSRPDVRDQLKYGDKAIIESAIKNLAWRIQGGTEEERTQQAIQLLAIVYDEYVERLEASKAVRQIERTITSAIESSGQSIERHIDVQIRKQSLDAEVFGFLEKIHPWRSSEARSLLSISPAFGNIIRGLLGSDDAKITLDNWVRADVAAINDASGEEIAWLARLAGDFDLPATQSILLRRALARGVANQSELAALAAIYAFDSGDSVEGAKLLEASCHGGPLHSVALSYISNEYQPAIEALGRWTPVRPSDQALKAAFTARILLSIDRVESAISLLEDSVETLPDAYGLKLTLARLLTFRASQPQGQLPYVDLQRARRLAIEARDGRRRYGMDSVSPVLAAAQAAAAAHDYRSAYSILLVAPRGTALAVEASDPQVMAEALVLATAMDDVETVKELRARITSPSLVKWSEGWDLAASGQLDKANDLWWESFQLASTADEKLRSAEALARHGGRMPDLSGLEDYSSVAVSRINEIRSALGSGHVDLASLRAQAPKSAVLTVELARRLRESGEGSQAATALEAGGDALRDSHLLLLAALEHLADQDFEGASRAAKAASRLGGESWYGGLDAKILEFQASEGLGKFSESLLLAEEIRLSSPDDPDARWNYIHCSLRAGEFERAWLELSRGTARLAPRNDRERQALIFLLCRSSNVWSELSEFLEILCQIQDPEIAGWSLALLYGVDPGPEAESNEGALNRLNNYVRDYLGSNPNSSTFRAINLREGEDVREAITSILRENDRSADLRPVIEMAENGSLPAAFPAVIACRPYSSVFFSPSLRVRLLNLAHGSTSSAVIEESAGGPVVIDISSIATLSLFPGQVRDGLIGAFSRLKSTTSDFRDLQEIQPQPDTRQTSRIYYSAESDSLRFQEIDLNAERLTAARAELGLEIISSFDHNYIASSEFFKPLDATFGFLSAGRRALEERLAFWCDDFVTSQLVRAEGGHSFNTYELICFMRARGSLSDGGADIALSAMLADGCVDLQPSNQVALHAAQLNGWTPKGNAVALSHASSWRDPTQTTNFIITVARNVSNRPLDLRDWMHWAFKGVAGLVAESDEKADNVSLLLGHLYDANFLSSENMPFVVAGAQSALGDGVLLESSLRKFLTVALSREVENHGWDIASAQIQLLVSGLGPGHRDLAAGVVLTLGL